MEHSHHFIIKINMCMCTYIMYLPVMSSFLSPYCCCTQTLHSDCHCWCSSAVTFSHRDFVSLNFTYSYFLLCIAYFSFHFTYTTCLQIKFHSLPYRPFKVLAFPEQCTEGVTLHSVTREECFWKPFQMLQRQRCFQMTVHFHVTSIHCASRNRDHFHLKQAQKIKYISK